MRVVIAVLCLGLLPGLLAAARKGILELIHDPGIWQPLLIGVIIGWPLFGLLSRVRGLRTVLHEISHAVVAVLLRRRITECVVTKDRGGYIRHSASSGPGPGDDLIGLAPYYLPLIPFIVIVGWALVPERSHSWTFSAMIGTALFVQAAFTTETTRTNWNKRKFRTLAGQVVQSDIGTRGYVFSAIMIASFLSAFGGLMSMLLVHKGMGFYVWLVTVCESTARLLSL